MLAEDQKEANLILCQLNFVAYVYTVTQHNNKIELVQYVFQILFRGANLSPFGEVIRFHLEIGHSRESCRSVIFFLKKSVKKVSSLGL